MIERLTYHQGRFPLRNWLPNGRPTRVGGLPATARAAIHLGAAASSGLGLGCAAHNSCVGRLWHGSRYFGLFNTPIAGVIFAMEVVMMEYTLMSFMPVILAYHGRAGGAGDVWQCARISDSRGGVRVADEPALDRGDCLVIGLPAGFFIHISQPQTLPLWLRLASVSAPGYWRGGFPKSKALVTTACGSANNQLAIMCYWR